MSVNATVLVKSTDFAGQCGLDCGTIGVRQMKVENLPVTRAGKTAAALSSAFICLRVAGFFILQP